MNGIQIDVQYQARLKEYSQEDVRDNGCNTVKSEYSEECITAQGGPRVTERWQ